MDELFDKFLQGEISDEQFNASLNQLPEDEKKKLDEKLADPAVIQRLNEVGKAALQRVVALRKEGNRLEDRPSVPDYGEKLRAENIETAKEKFFADRNIPAEEQAQYNELFKSNDSGHVSVDLIYGDLQKIYATLHASELIELQQRYQEMQQGGNDFLLEHAGPAGTGEPGGEGGARYDQAVYDWVKASRAQGINITPEQADKILRRGLKRVF